MAKGELYNKYIHTTQWLRLRKMILSEHPVCQACEEKGVLSPATEVHHITPVEYALSAADTRRLMFDPHNLRALCHDCHVREHIELGRSGRAATKRRNEAQVRAAVDKFFGAPGQFFKKPGGRG